MRTIVFFFFTCVLFTSCTLLFPRHFGKIELINESGLNKADNFLVLPYAHTYYFQSNVFVSRQPFVVSRNETDTTGTSAPTPESKGYKKNSEMMNYERMWDSIITKKLNIHFKNSTYLKYEPNNTYGQYRFKYRFRTKTTNFVMAEYNDVQMAHVAWLIKDDFADSAKKKLPAQLLEQSYKNPVIIIANFSYFHETEFQANYSTGSTGTQVSPVSMIVIIKNGEFVYYRNAQAAKAYKNDKYVRKVLARITDALFDKIK